MFILSKIIDKNSFNDNLAILLLVATDLPYRNSSLFFHKFLIYFQVIIQVNICSHLFILNGIDMISSDP